MSLSPSDRPGDWTFDNLSDLAEDDRRYEIVDGALVPMTPPTHLHDRVVKLLDRQIDSQLPPEWETLTELGLRLGTDGRLPDLAVVRTDVPFDRHQVGIAPEHVHLVAEVVSRGSRKNDRFFKPIEYALAGIPHYWRVETDPELFVVTHELRDGAYAATAVLRGRHLVAPFGMTLDVPALLPRQLRD